MSVGGVCLQVEGICRWGVSVGVCRYAFLWVVAITTASEEQARHCMGSCSCSRWGVSVGVCRCACLWVDAITTASEEQAQHCMVQLQLQQVGCFCRSV